MTEPHPALSTVVSNATSRRLAKIVLYLSIGLFIVACALPALSFHAARDRNYLGLELLLFGFLRFPTPLIGWAANVALVVGWVMLGRYAFDAQGESFVLASVVCAVIALIASADVFALFQTALQSVAEPLGDGYYYRLDHFLPGAYLWWASQISLVFGSAWLFARESSSLRAAGSPLASAQ